MCVGHVPLPRRTFENWAKKLNFQRYVFLGYVFAVGYVFAGPDFGTFTKKLSHFTKNGEKSDETKLFLENNKKKRDWPLYLHHVFYAIRPGPIEPGEHIPYGEHVP